MNRYFISFLVIIIAFIVGCNNPTKKAQNTSTVDVDSISILTNLLISDSLNANLLASRAELYLRKGNIDPALRDLQAALSLAPNDAGLFILLADIYLVLGQTDNSIASLKKAIRLEPANEIPYLKLTEVYLQLDDPTTALRYVDEAISLNSQNTESYYVKAIGLMAKQDTAAAIINLKISSNLDSSNYMANMHLGVIYTASKDPLSKDYFEKALVARPDDEKALYYLGMYYQELREFSKALDKYSRITELYKSNKRAYYNMGYIYLVEYEDFENAKLMFQEAISINPRFIEATYNLGRTLEALGDLKGAREYYKKSLELLPNYPLAVQGMNRLDDMLRKK